MTVAEELRTINVFFEDENGKQFDTMKGIGFAYDGCHKIYILENDKDTKDLQEIGYEIHDLSELAETFENSCELRFINSANLKKTLIPQFAENVRIEVLG